MNNMRWVNLAMLLAVALGCGAIRPTPSLRPDIVVQAESEATPWTHLDFKNRPVDFRFAIVSDRTGGRRPGVFTAAVRKLNLLQPEFVMCVGDLIRGYTEDEAELDRQQDEFDRIVEQLEMPFFRLPGNHDISNAVMAEHWQKRYGQPYYHFVYQDVLFLCLNSEDPTVGHISAEQIAYVSGALDENPEVRWTLVFLHEPVWLYSGKTGWEEVVAALEGRPYTVFAGHYHQYMKYERSGMCHFILGTTGGRSRLGGPLLGQFDHVVWVTMTDQGPRVANLLLEGIWDEDVRAEQTATALDSLLHGADEVVVSGPAPIHEVLTVCGTNPLEDSLTVSWEWTDAGAWKVRPTSGQLRLGPGERGEMGFELTGEGTQPYPPPLCTVIARVRRKCVGAVGSTARIRELRKTSVARADAFCVDGKDEESWDKAAAVQGFTDWQGHGPGWPATHTRLAHDGRFLYVFARLAEPEMALLSAERETRDADVWNDDCFEVFVQPPGQGYYHIVVNSEGVTYDCYRPTGSEDLSWDPPLQIATALEEGAWTVEMAVPFEALGRTPVPGESWRGNFCRERYPVETKRSCWSCTLGGFHKPDRFGEVVFE